MSEIKCNIENCIDPDLEELIGDLPLVKPFSPGIDSVQFSVFSKEIIRESYCLYCVNAKNRTTSPVAGESLMVTLYRVWRDKQLRKELGMGEEQPIDLTVEIKGLI